MITYGSTTLTSYNTITKIEIYYYKSTSSTDLAGGSWSTTKPTWENGKYIWQKIRTTYEGKLANGQFYSESDPVNITGQQGKSGEAASSYKLTSSESAIVLLKTGEYSTNQITFNATYKQGTNPIAPYNGGFVIQYSINGAEWVTDYTSLSNESSKTYTIPESILIIRCLLYQTKDCDELLDIVTVPIIKDGIDGTGVTNSFPIYLVHDKDEGITLDDHGWTRFKPSLDAENKYLWIDYISRYAEGNIKPQLIEKTGNKITFEYHGERSPFENVIIDITPVQSGSGIPSSSNNRHISGWTSIDIGQADINLMSYEEGKYTLDLPEDIGTLDNQTLNLENTMFTIQGDTLIITKSDLGTHITFPEEVGTVYGGKYNVTTGVLMVTHGYIDEYNNELLPSTWISDRNVYVKGTKPSVGAQVVFELNEPLIYELTPQEIMIFEHSNSIYASTGDISISYYDYQTTTSPYIDYALVSAFDASTAALEEATQLKQDFQELQEDIQTQLDQKVETWCQINDPALSWTTTELKQQHNGDLWYYIGESNISYKNNTTYKYVASTGKWMPYAVSADLFDKIDTKTTIYYGQTTDLYPNVESGDYLVDSTDGCSYKYNGSQWVKITDYKTSIDAAIDDIEIGGRNLVLNSATEVTSKNQITTYSLSEYGQSFIKGKEIIISADIKSSAANTGLDLYIRASGTSSAENDYTTITGIGTSYTRFTKVVTVYNNSHTPNQIAFRTTQVSNTATFNIKNVKVELGNKATDWTPAPEDVDVHNYITDIDTKKGITVKPIDTSGNDYLQLNSSAISFYKSNVETSRFEDSAIRIGKIGANQNNVYITDSAVNIRNNESVLASFGETTTIGVEGDMQAVTAPQGFAIITPQRQRIFAVGDIEGAPSAMSEEVITGTSAGTYTVINANDLQKYWYIRTPIVVSMSGYTSISIVFGTASTQKIGGLTFSYDGLYDLTYYNPGLERTFTYNWDCWGEAQTAFGLTVGGRSNLNPDIGEYSMSIGFDNVASGDNSGAVGSYLTVEKDNKFVVGTYNSDKTNTLFEVGNGTSSSSSNAFEVTDDGDTRMNLESTENLYIAINALGWISEVTV